MNRITGETGQEMEFQGLLVQVQRDTLVRDGQAVEERVCLHKGAAAVLALWQGKICLVRQYRYAQGRECLEIPAGKLDPGEDPCQAARRELREETGLEAGSMVLLAALCSSPDVLAETLYLYWAQDLRQAEARLDEGEFLDVEGLEPEQLAQLICQGQVQDAKTLAALALARRRGLLPG